MDRSYTDQLNRLMRPVTEDDIGVNRCKRLLSLLTSGLGAVIPVFFIGLVSGGAGGALLGGTAVVLLQSLELLADNSTVMDQLEKLMMDNDPLEHGVGISLFAMMFGVFSSTLILPVGVYIGFKTYSLEIKRKGEAAQGKALALAGSVCLLAVTVPGYIMGLALESFLSFKLNEFSWLLKISTVLCIFKICMCPVMTCFLRRHFIPLFLLGVALTLMYALVTQSLCHLIRMRVILATTCSSVIFIVRLLDKSRTLLLHTVTLRLMLIISDVYKIAGQHIVASQSPTSTAASTAVIEDIFVGLLASLMWMVTVGMSLFVSLQRGGAGKVCAAATVSGTAFLGAIKLVPPALGPGPTIGALMGVAGAAGVSLSAAATATDQYGPIVGRFGSVGKLGVTVGAAGGAFAFACAHNGLSGMFMALCAATVPPGAFLMTLLHSTSSKGHSYQCLISAAAVLFTLSTLFYTSSAGLVLICFLPSVQHEFLAFVFESDCLEQPQPQTARHYQTLYR